MEWVVVQLTSYAEKHISTAELAREMRRRLATPDLELFYPSIEDVVGKHVSTFAEYAFIEYRPGIDYSELEGGDFFKTILRNQGADKAIQILPDQEVDKVRNSTEREQILNPGDRVRILQGPLKGNVGKVERELDGQVSLTVSMGEIGQDAIIPRHWVRPMKKKTSSVVPTMETIHPNPLDDPRHGVGIDGEQGD